MMQLQRVSAAPPNIIELSRSSTRQKTNTTQIPSPSNWYMELTPQQVIIITLVHCLVTISKTTVAKTKSAASTRWDDIKLSTSPISPCSGDRGPVPALRLSAKHNWRNQFATDLGCREIHTLTLDTGMGNGRDGITPLVAVRKGPKRCIVLELRTRAWRWCAVCRDPATFAWIAPLCMYLYL